MIRRHTPGAAELELEPGTPQFLADTLQVLKQLPQGDERSAAWARVRLFGSTWIAKRPLFSPPA